jgi:hypothetical protein
VQVEVQKGAALVEETRLRLRGPRSSLHIFEEETNHDIISVLVINEHDTWTLGSSPGDGGYARTLQPHVSSLPRVIMHQNTHPFRCTHEEPAICYKKWPQAAAGTGLSTLANDAFTIIMFASVALARGAFAAARMMHESRRRYRASTHSMPESDLGGWKLVGGGAASRSEIARCCLSSGRVIRAAILRHCSESSQLHSWR